MLLSSDERRKFAAYCRQCAESCERIAQQGESLFLNIGPLLGQKERAKAAAYTIVANDIEEADTIAITKGGDV